MVHGRADNNHAATTGLIGIVGKLMGNFDHLSARYAGDFFLPSWGVRHIVIKAFCAIGATQSIIDTIIGQRKIKHCCHQGTAAIRKNNPLGWHFALLYLAVIGVLKIIILMFLTTEIREGHVDDFICQMF